jgi:hypothetical protein
MNLNLRLLIVIVLSTGLGWLVFTVLFHEDLSETSSEDGIKGVMPGLPSVKRRRAFSTPAPVVKPKGGECPFMGFERHLPLGGRKMPIMFLHLAVFLI